MDYSFEKIVPDWSLLNREYRYIIDEIIEEWEGLLQKDLNEEEYHKFLSKHSQIFFTDYYEKEYVISKLRLGADYIPDFIVTINKRSYGIYYEFIEIESPHSPPYVKKGQPSERLSQAVQQVMNWQEWIKDNRYQIRKLLQSSGVRLFRNPNFRFKIIIGNSENSKQWLEERNQYSKKLGIEIRSFDSLTYFAQQKYFKWKYDDKYHQFPENIQQQLANPFVYAYSDSDWRSILRESKYQRSSYVFSNPGVLLFYQQSNDAYDRFFEETEGN